MIARQVNVVFKPEMSKDFLAKMQTEVLPLLRKQEGFLDQLVFVGPDKKLGLSITLWDRKENMEKYHTNIFPQVTKTVEKMLEGTPGVATYDVPLSSMHRLGVA
ncbi:MAG TPA: hypothetical protein VGA40_09940 [Candidatus Acidoferrales bacterium]